MAGNIPMGSMSTEIKLNGSQSVKTLKELKQAVSQATSAWKAQRAELSTIGKSTEAAEAKYKGLAETIKKQKDYISGLQVAQKHLQEAQKSVDRSTKEGRQEYGKYNEALQKNETRIHSAEQRLAGLTDQQSKAQKSLDYYKSGLASAQKQLKLNESVTRSYIDRLSSEGKGYEAAKAKLNGYKDSIENLTKQRKIQEQELSKIASESGKSGEAYKLQQVRVNETVASLAKAKTQMTDLDNSMKKANPSFLDRIRSKLTGVNEEANQTHKTFKEVFAGSFLGNALSNAVSNVTGQLKNIVTEGMNLNAALAKINGRFKSMGMSDRYIKILDNQIGELKAQTNMTGDNVANLQAKMLNWSNIGRKGAMQMVKMIAGVGDSSKLTGDQIEQMGASLMRVGSTGKVTYSALNRVTKSAPTFMAQLAKGAGMSEDKLKSLLKSGKVTQNQFQKWMAAASKYSDTAFKGFGKTQGGALKYMKVRWQKLEQTMTKPIFDAKTSGLQSLKNIMSSPELQKGAEAIGNAMSATLGYLDRHKKDIAGITSDITHIGVELAKDLWKDFASIITTIGNMFGITAKHSKGSSGAIHVIAQALNSLSKNKLAIKAIADSIVAIAAVKGLNRVGGGLFAIGEKGYQAYRNVKMLVKGIQGIKDIKGLSDAEKGLLKFGNGIRGLASKFLQAGKFLGSKLAQGIKATMKFGMGKRLAAGALAGAAVATPEVINAIKDRHSANRRSQDIGGAVGAVAGGTLTSMIPVVGPMLAPIGAIVGKYAGRWGGQAVNKFTKGWQAKKPPKNFWSLENLGYSTHNMWKGFTKGVSNTIKWFKKNWKEVGLYLINPLAGAINSLYKHNKGFRKWVKGVSKIFKEGFNQAKKYVHNSIKDILSFINDLGKSIHKQWHSLWNGLADFFESIWKSIKRTASKYFGKLRSTMTDIGKSIHKQWHSLWNGLADFFESIWKSIKRTASKYFGKLRSTMTDIGKSIHKQWHSLWNGLADFFESIWKSIKKTASGGINGVVGVINDGISGIDNVIHSFGGKSHAISLIPKVKLAKGTLGNLTPSITKPTMALLNDGHDSPETGNKETVWDTKTGALGVVNGTNVPFLLQPGMEVFSASQSRNLGFTHFAKGTNPLVGFGKFFGGIGSWIGQKTNQLKKWFELATKIVSHPIQALSSLMHPGSKGLNGIFVQLGKGMFDKSKDAAVNWWSALWNMASSKLNGDDGPATGLLKAVEKYGEGHKYVWGAAGSSSFDCSGLVMYALKHAYGIDFPHFSGSQYGMTQHISRDQAKMGDLVFWGSHGDEHVGVYAGGNKYFSAQSPSQGIHMNTLDSVVGYGKPLFGRVRGLSQSSSKKDAVKATNGLQKMIKAQVGNGFFEFISKLGDLFGITGEAGTPTGDHTHWMKQAHIPRSDWDGLNYIISAESGWNPKAVNPTSGTYGLGQMQGYNLHYYTKHGGKSNAIAQLMGIMDYIHDRYGSVTNAVRFRKAHNWYANGGIASTPSFFGEAGPEMAIPLIPSKSTRAWELIGKAVGILSANSNFNNQQQVNLKEKKEEHDFRQAMLLLLTEIAGKSDVAKITLTTPAGRDLWSVIQPFQKQEMRSEITRLRKGLSGGR